MRMQAFLETNYACQTVLLISTFFDVIRPYYEVCVNNFGKLSELTLSATVWEFFKVS